MALQKLHPSTPEETALLLAPRVITVLDRTIPTPVFCRIQSEIQHTKTLISDGPPARKILKP